uniref:Uncharacterized protein n=1 Tax=Arundo donax TaxID=35708 RepID=A0A0A9FUZ6_ARUDO
MLTVIISLRPIMFFLSANQLRDIYTPSTSVYFCQDTYN